MKKYPQIILLHIIGCCMILLCHFFQNARIGWLSEIFIAGLSLFFLISGFLAGLKSDFGFNWVRKRFMRILKPYYVVIIIACVVYFLFARSEISWKSLIFLFTCSQGLNYIYWPFEEYQAMAGFGHFWYITEILLCVLVTPIINSFYNKVKLSNIEYAIFILFLFFIIQPVAIVNGIQFGYIITYFMGFVLSRRKIEYNMRNMAFTVLFFFLISLLRLVGMIYLDGTDIYDRYIALLSQMSFSLVIFVSLFYMYSAKSAIVETIAFCKTSIFMSSITYEIYLVHYFFLRGVWPVQKYISNMFWADVVVVLFSVLCAIILKHMLNLISLRK